MLKIGLANWEALDSRPVDWAKRHSNLLIEALLTPTERRIKEACDDPPRPEPDLTREDLEEIVHWRTWRVPKLIYMQPASNAPYDPAKA